MVKKSLVLALLFHVSFVIPANVIFDVGGVLFKANALRAARLIGVTNILCDAITCNKTWQMQDRFFSVLNEVSIPGVKKDNSGATYHGAPLPAPMVSWMKGNEVSTQSLLTHVHNHINASTLPFYEKNMYLNIAQIMFNPAINAYIMDPIAEGIALAQALHAVTDAQGIKKHRLFILSNYNEHAFDELVKKHSDIFALFDANKIYVSGKIGMIKPNVAFYKKLLKDWDINPTDGQTYFIDDQAENIRTAEALGIKSLLFTKNSAPLIKYIIDQAQ